MEKDNLLLVNISPQILKKRSLIMHLVAFAVIALLLIILFTFAGRGSHLWANWAHVVSRPHLNTLIESPHFESYYNELDEMQRVVNFVSNKPHNIWFVLLGAMATWGGYLLVHSTFYVYSKARRL